MDSNIVIRTRGNEYVIVDEASDLSGKLNVLARFDTLAEAFESAMHFCENNTYKYGLTMDTICQREILKALRRKS